MLTNIPLWLKANSEVISNITYHDVKGHKDDMEKKRSLQGGGENTAKPYADEFKPPEPKPSGQDHGRVSADYGRPAEHGRSSQDHGRMDYGRPEQGRMSAEPERRHGGPDYGGYSSAAPVPQPGRGGGSYTAVNQPSSRSTPPAAANSYITQG